VNNRLCHQCFVCAPFDYSSNCFFFPFSSFFFSILQPFYFSLVY
jgi:hypothetical protein